MAGQGSWTPLMLRPLIPDVRISRRSCADTAGQRGKAGQRRRGHVIFRHCGTAQAPCGAGCHQADGAVQRVQLGLQPTLHRSTGQCRSASPHCLAVFPVSRWYCIAHQHAKATWQTSSRERVETQRCTTAPRVHGTTIITPKPGPSARNHARRRTALFFVADGAHDWWCCTNTETAATHKSACSWFTPLQKKVRSSV